MGIYLDDVIDARASLLRALRRSANFIQSLLLIVLFNMLEYLSDFDDDFECDGRIQTRRKGGCRSRERNSWPENNRPLHVHETMLTGGVLLDDVYLCQQSSENFHHNVIGIE